MEVSFKTGRTSIYLDHSEFSPVCAFCMKYTQNKPKTVIQNLKQKKLAWHMDEETNPKKPEKKHSLKLKLQLFSQQLKML